MEGNNFHLGHVSYSKTDLLERMCRVGIARWGGEEAERVALLEREIDELGALNAFLLEGIKARRKQLSTLKRHLPTPQQQLWDEQRIERTVAFLSTHSSFRDAASTLGIGCDSLQKALTTSLKLLRRREQRVDETASADAEMAPDDIDPHDLESLLEFLEVEYAQD